MQRLISVGMDPRSENHPYLAFVFTSFQVGRRYTRCNGALSCVLARYTRGAAVQRQAANSKGEPASKHPCSRACLPACVPSPAPAQPNQLPSLACIAACQAARAAMKKKWKNI